MRTVVAFFRAVDNAVAAARRRARRRGRCLIARAGAVTDLVDDTVLIVRSVAVAIAIVGFVKVACARASRVADLTRFAAPDNAIAAQGTCAVRVAIAEGIAGTGFGRKIIVSIGRVVVVIAEPCFAAVFERGIQLKPVAPHGAIVVRVRILGTRVCAGCFVDARRGVKGGKRGRVVAARAVVVERIDRQILAKRAAEHGAPRLPRA